MQIQAFEVKCGELIDWKESSNINLQKYLLTYYFEGRVFET